MEHDAATRKNRINLHVVTKIKDSAKYIYY